MRDSQFEKDYNERRNGALEKIDITFELKFIFFFLFLAIQVPIVLGVFYGGFTVPVQIALWVIIGVAFLSLCGVYLYKRHEALSEFARKERHFKMPAVRYRRSAWVREAADRANLDKLKNDRANLDKLKNDRANLDKLKNEVKRRLIKVGEDSSIIISDGALSVELPKADFDLQIREDKPVKQVRPLVQPVVKPSVFEVDPEGVRRFFDAIDSQVEPSDPVALMDSFFKIWDSESKEKIQGKL